MFGPRRRGRGRGDDAATATAGNDGNALPTRARVNPCELSFAIAVDSGSDEGTMGTLFGPFVLRMRKEEIREIRCENISCALRDEPCVKFVHELASLRIDVRK